MVIAATMNGPLFNMMHSARAANAASVTTSAREGRPVLAMLSSTSVAHGDMGGLAIAIVTAIVTATVVQPNPPRREYNATKVALWAYPTHRRSER